MEFKEVNIIIAHTEKIYILESFDFTVKIYENNDKHQDEEFDASDNEDYEKMTFNEYKNRRDNRKYFDCECILPVDQDCNDVNDWCHAEDRDDVLENILHKYDRSDLKINSLYIEPRKYEYYYILPEKEIQDTYHNKLNKILKKYRYVKIKFGRAFFSKV